MMNVKEVTVTRDNIIEIFSTIKEELLQNPNTQVFIDSRLIAIFLKDITKGVLKNGVEVEWKNNQSAIVPSAKFTVYEEQTRYSNILFVATIEFNTNDYCQLKGLEMKDFNYISHIVNFKQMLLIQMK